MIFEKLRKKASASIENRLFPQINYVVRNSRKIGNSLIFLGEILMENRVVLVVRIHVDDNLWLLFLKVGKPLDICNKNNNK